MQLEMSDFITEIIKTKMQMKKTILFFLILLCFTAPLSAQKNNKKKKKEKKEEKIEITSETRKISSIFADGLREFYSDNFNRAEQSFRAVITRAPKNDAAFYMMSKVKIAQKDLNGAEYYLSEARKLNPKNEWYLLGMAELYDQLGNFKQSAKLWEEVCTLKSDNEFYLIALSEAYLQLNRLSDVIKVYDRIEKMVGRNDEITAVKKNIYLYLNDVKSAAGEYEKLIQLYPHEIEYYLEVAKIYSANGMNDKARSFYETALQKDPKNTQLHLALIDYYKAIGKSEESQNSLMMVLQSPDFPIEKKFNYLQPLLDQCIKTKNKTMLQQMEDIFTVLAKTNPNDYETWAGFGILCFLNDDYVKARKNFEKALSLHFGDYYLWEYYIETLLKTEDYATIVDKADEISELFPISAQFLYTLGYVFDKTGNNTEKAIDYLTQASIYAVDANLIESICDLLGDIYMKLDNKTEALKNWKKAIRRPGPNVQKIREKIAKNE